MDRFALAWIHMGLERDDRVILQAPNCAYGFLSQDCV